MLDTEFGPRCDLTNLLVLTRSQQDVSSRKCVAAMISLPRLHTSRSSQVTSAFASIALLDSGTPVRFMIVGSAETANYCRTASHCLALADFCILGSTCRMRTLSLMGSVDGRDRHRIARKCAGTGGRCSVTGQNLSTLKLHHHAHRLILRVTTPALPLNLLRLPFFSPWAPTPERIL